MLREDLGGLFMKLGALVALAAATLLPANALAGQIIRCEAKGAERVEITLGGGAYEGTTLNCIDADFVSDMSGCAPDEGWSLSRPTGNAGIVGLVYRWQDYIDHVGGVVGFRLSDSAYYFDGGYKSSEFQKWFGQWLFVIDRVTGVGKLSEQPEGAPSGTLKLTRTYSCSAVSRKF